MQSEQLQAFRDGLYRVLVAGDVAEFGRYLRRWEDLIGDTADLADTSEAQQRRTMEALLRRPQQFNLPPWPREGPRATPAPTESRPGPASPAPARGLPTTLAPAAPPMPLGPPAPPAATAPTTLAAPSLPDRRESESVYQVHMLTGELVPVPGGAPGGRHDEPVGELTEPAPTGAPRRRVRRRRLPSGMTQLRMWSDDEPAG